MNKSAENTESSSKKAKKHKKKSKSDNVKAKKSSKTKKKDGKDSKKRKKSEISESKSEKDRPKKKHKKDDPPVDVVVTTENDIKTGANNTNTQPDNMTVSITEPVVDEKKPIDDVFLVQYPLSVFSPGRILAPFYESEGTFQTCVSLFRDIHFKFAFCNDTFGTSDMSLFKQQIYDLGVNKMIINAIDWSINIVTNDEKFHTLRDNYLKIDYVAPNQPKRKKSTLLPYFNVRLVSSRNIKDENYLSFKFSAVDLEPSKGRKPILDQFDTFGAPIIKVSHLFLKNVFVQSMLLDSAITNAVEDSARSLTTTFKRKLDLSLTNPEIRAEFSKAFTDNCRYKYPVIPLSSTDIDNCTSSFARCTNSSTPNVDILTAGNASIFFPTHIYSKFMVPVFRSEECFGLLIQSIVGKKTVKNSDTILRYESALKEVLSTNKPTDSPELKMVNYPFAVSFLMHFIVQVIQEPKYTMGQNDRGFVDITSRRDPYVFSNDNVPYKQQQSINDNITHRIAAKTLQTRNSESINKIHDEERGANLREILTTNPAMIANRVETFLESCIDSLAETVEKDDTTNNTTKHELKIRDFLNVLNSDSYIHELFSAFEKVSSNVDDADKFMESISNVLSFSKINTILTICSSMGINSVDADKMLVLLRVLKQKWDAYTERQLLVKHTTSSIENSLGVVCHPNTPKEISNGVMSNEDFAENVWNIFKDIRRQNQANTQNSLFYEDNGVGFYGTTQMFLSCSEYCNPETSHESLPQDFLHKFSTSQWAVLTLPDSSECFIPSESSRVIYDATYHGISLCSNNTDSPLKKDKKQHTVNSSIGVSILKPAVIRKLINLYSQECKIMSMVYVKFQELHSDISNAMFFDFHHVQNFVTKNLADKIHNGNRVTCLVYEFMSKLVEKLIPLRMASIKEQETFLNSVGSVSSSNNNDNNNNENDMDVSDEQITSQDTTSVKMKIENTIKQYADDLTKLQNSAKVLQSWLEDTKNEFGLAVQCCYSLLDNIYCSNDPKQVILSMMSFTLITKFNSSRKACEFTKDYLASYIPYATQKLTPGLGNIACNMPHLSDESTELSTNQGVKIDLQPIYPNYITTNDSCNPLIHKHNMPNVLESFNRIFTNTLVQSTSDTDKLLDLAEESVAKKPVMNTIKYMDKRMKFMESYLPTIFQNFLSESESIITLKSKKRTKTNTTGNFTPIHSSSSLSSSSSSLHNVVQSHLQYVLTHHQYSELPGIKNSCQENAYAFAPPFPFVAYSLNWVLNGMPNFKISGNFDQLSDENNDLELDSDNHLNKKQKKKTGSTSDINNNETNSLVDNPETQSRNTPTKVEPIKPQYIPIPHDVDKGVNGSIFTKKVTSNQGLDYIGGARVVNLDLDEQLDIIAKHIYNVTNAHGEMDVPSILSHERHQSIQTYDQCVPTAIHHAQKTILSSMKVLMNKHHIPVDLGEIISTQVAELPISCETKKSFFDGLDKKYSETNGVITARKFSPLEQYKHIFTQVVIEHANNPGKYLTQRQSLFIPDLSRNLHLVVFVDVNKTTPKKNNANDDQTGGRTKLTETLVDYTYSCFAFMNKIDKSVSYLFQMIQNTPKNNNQSNFKPSILNHRCANNIDDHIVKAVISQQVNIIRPLLISCINEDFFSGITKIVNPSLKQKTIKRYGDLSGSILGRTKLHPFFDFFINKEESESGKRSKSSTKFTPEMILRDFLCSLFLQTDTIYLRTRQYPFLLWIPFTTLHLPVLKGSDTTNFTRGVVTSTKDIHKIVKIADVLKLSDESKEELLQEILVTEKRNTHHLTVKFSASQKLLNSGDKSFRSTENAYRCHMKLSNQLYGMRKYIGKSANLIWSTIDLLLSTHLLQYIKQFMHDKLGYRSKYMKRLIKQSKYFGAVLYEKLKEKFSKDTNLDFNFLEVHSQVNHDGLKIDREIASRKSRGIVLNLDANETMVIDAEGNSHTYIGDTPKKTSDVQPSSHTTIAKNTCDVAIPRITSLKESWLDLADIGFLTTKEDLFLFATASSIIMSFFFATTSSEDLKSQFNIDDDVCGIEERVCTIKYMTPMLSKNSSKNLNFNIKQLSLSHAYVNFQKLADKVSECNTETKAFAPLLETLGSISKDETLFEENNNVRNLVYIMGNVADIFKREKVDPWISKKNRSFFIPKKQTDEKNEPGYIPDLLDSPWMTYAFYTILDYIAGLPSLPFSKIGTSVAKEKWVLPIAAQIFSCLSGTNYVEDNIVAKSINKAAKSRGKSDIIHSDSSIDDTQQTTEHGKLSIDQEAEDMDTVYTDRGSYTREHDGSLCNILTNSEKVVVLECVVKTIKYISLLGNLLLHPPKDKTTIIERKLSKSSVTDDKNDASATDTKSHTKKERRRDKNGKEHKEKNDKKQKKEKKHKHDKKHRKDKKDKKGKKSKHEKKERKEPKEKGRKKDKTESENSGVKTKKEKKDKTDKDTNKKHS